MLFCIMLVTACRSNTQSGMPSEETQVEWVKPVNFPEPVYPLMSNMPSPAGIELGRRLFYDPALSKDNTISCASCHQQTSAFSNAGLDVSHGVGGGMSKRNAPALQNLAWSPAFFADGGVHDLDFAPFNPIQDKSEMGETVKGVIVKLKKQSSYRQLFFDSFGTEEITSLTMMKALSQFMITLISADSKYDRYMRGDRSLFSEEEKEGLTIFEQKCASCHSGVLFTDHSFRNNGLVPSVNNDRGRFEVTRLAADKYKFKVPSLRNVAYTPPYMHDGRFKSLEAVLDHYRSGVHRSATLDSLLNGNQQMGIILSEAEGKKVIMFLKTLSDETFLKNEKLSAPKEAMP